MSLRILLGGLCAVVLLLCGGAARPPELYVKNRPFEGKVIVRRETVYAQADALARALGVTLDRDGEKPAVAGKAIPDAFVAKEGGWYVPLKPFVEAAGYKLLHNTDTGIIDVLPGTSQLTPEQVRALESRAKLARSEPQRTGAAPADARALMGEAEALLKRLVELGKEYRPKLAQRPDILSYLVQMDRWEKEVMGWGNGYFGRLSGLKSLKTKQQVLAELTALLQSASDFIPRTRESFKRMSPPPEFQASHGIRQRVVDRYSDLELLIGEAQRLLQELSGASPEREEAIERQFNELAEQKITPLVTQQLRDGVSYLQALVEDIQKLR